MSKATEMLVVLLLATTAFTQFSCTEAQLIPGLPNIQECSKAIFETQDCLPDIFRSLLSFRIQLSSQCCKAIDDISDDCFQNIFAAFNPFFPPLVKAFCADPKGSTSPPAVKN